MENPGGVKCSGWRAAREIIVLYIWGKCSLFEWDSGSSGEDLVRSIVAASPGFSRFAPNFCHFRMFKGILLRTSFERGSMTNETTGEQAPQTPEFIRYGITGSGRVHGVFLDADGRERSKLIRTLKPDEALEAHRSGTRSSIYMDLPQVLMQVVQRRKRNGMNGLRLWLANTATALDWSRRSSG